MTDMGAANFVYMLQFFRNNVHNVLDHGIVNDKLPVVAEHGPDDRPLAETAALRRRCLEKTLDRVDEIA